MGLFQGVIQWSISNSSRSNLQYSLSAREKWGPYWKMATLIMRVETWTFRQMNTKICFHLKKKKRVKR